MELFFKKDLKWSFKQNIEFSPSSVIYLKKNEYMLIPEI